MMGHSFSKAVLSLIAAWAIAAPSAVRAQDSDAAGALYSQGVDAFFAGRLDRADLDLSRAIALNPDDPRPFYFRALSRLRDGRRNEASADMQLGAELEARRPNRFAIGKTLERVQGPDRLLLEQYRRDARVSSMTSGNPTFSVHPVTEQDSAVLRERRVVPLDAFLQPGTPRLIAVPKVAPAKTNSAAIPAAKAPQKTAPAVATDPFSDDAAPKSPPTASPANSPPKPSPAISPPVKTPPAKAPPPATPKTAPAGPQSPAGDDNPFL